MENNYCYVCLKWGTKYSAEYVNKLASMIRKWDSAPIDIYCYTDDPVNIDSSIKIIPIPQLDYETWWFKLPLLVEPTLQRYRTKILFDLDVIIHNDISMLHKIEEQHLIVCKSLWKDPAILLDHLERNTLYNSSIMVWKDAQYIYDHFCKDPERYMAVYKGIDRYLWHEKLLVSTLPPNFVYSYNKGASLQDSTPRTYRPGYSVCLFHQQPKQHNINDEWVKTLW